MTGREVLADLDGRLARGIEKLRQLVTEAEDEGAHVEAERLRGKADGMTVARSYVRDMSSMLED